MTRIAADLLVVYRHSVEDAPFTERDRAILEQAARESAGRSGQRGWFVAACLAGAAVSIILLFFFQGEDPHHALRTAGLQEGASRAELLQGVDLRFAGLLETGGRQ